MGVDVDELKNLIDERDALMHGERGTKGALNER